MINRENLKEQIAIFLSEMGINTDQFTFEKSIEVLYDKLKLQKSIKESHYSLNFTNIAIVCDENIIIAQSELEGCRKLITSYKKSKVLKSFFVRVFPTLKLVGKEFYAPLVCKQVMYELERTTTQEAQQIANELSNLLGVKLSIIYK